MPGTMWRVDAVARSTSAAAPHAEDHFFRRASVIATALAAGGIAVRLTRSRIGLRRIVPESLSSPPIMILWGLERFTRVPRAVPT